jgi:TrmH family RNA methyltransferase
MEIITSSENVIIKNTKKLFEDKKHRDSEKKFAVEGIRIINDLIKQDKKLEYLIFDENFKGTNKFFGRKSYIVKSHLFDKISQLKNSEGIIGVFAKSYKDFKFEKNKKYIALENVQNPGNLGNIIRTSSCLNIDGIILNDQSVDIFSPISIRNSMGSILNIPLLIVKNLASKLVEFKKDGYKVYSTILDDKAKKINETNFDSSSIVVFGNEGNGVSKDIITISDENIYIPINSSIDSLNIASAAAIVIWELKK